MSETHLSNAPESRTPTGEIIDQSQATTPSETSTTPVETKPQDQPKVETKPETKDAEGKSILNQKDDAKAGAPEKYEAFKVPEGFTLDEAVAKEAGELFKGLNLNQEGAQKLVDFYSAKVREAAEAPYKLVEEQNKKWQDEMRADVEIGSKLSEVKTTVSKAIDGLGDPVLAQAFREAMDLTGAGNHVAFAKVFYKLAQKVTEGSHVSGNGPSPFGQRSPNARPESAAKAMYPNNP